MMSSIRGAVEAPRPRVWSLGRLLAHQLVRDGYTFVTSYPGSPTTEITDELERLAKRGLISFRYATNEKVAFEMAAAVAISGGRAAVVMKHVGLNVALDSVLGVAYTGQTGALLLVVGDDPSCESSSTEQDSRLLARLASIPCLEPSSVHDLQKTLELATAISMKAGSVAMLRLTTALCHGSAQIAYAPADRAAAAVSLSAPRGVRRFLLLPAISRENRVHNLARLDVAAAWGEAPELWEETEAGETSGGVAFIVQNALHEPFMRACTRLGLSPATLRSRMSWPLASGRLRAFLDRHPSVVVVEELETVLEDQVLAVVHREQLATRVDGREWFPRHGRLDEERLTVALGERLRLSSQRPFGRQATLALALPARPPTFCAGCPHTASFFSLKTVLESLPERPFVATDIGCYTLGTKPGLEVGDIVLCMGAGIGIATGMALAGQKSIALIGDSTFVHAGLPALKNAVIQGVTLLICVFDNGQAAMTGGPATTAGDLAAIALGLGAVAVETVDPFDVVGTGESLRRLLETPGVSVMISKSPCALTIPAKPRRPRLTPERCTGCGDCVTKIHCPAISLSAARKFEVAVDQCVGCGLCSAVCPEKAITPEPYE
jgi:indolepyruvate ferredoxin oxidoreductase, alpha subunit